MVYCYANTLLLLACLTIGGILQNAAAEPCRGKSLAGNLSKATEKKTQHWGELTRRPGKLPHGHLFFAVELSRRLELPRREELRVEFLPMSAGALAVLYVCREDARKVLGLVIGVAVPDRPSHLLPESRSSRDFQRAAASSPSPWLDLQC
jgi:hypothetical protein